MRPFEKGACDLILMLILDFPKKRMTMRMRMIKERFHFSDTLLAESMQQRLSFMRIGW
jgi:hypothetical protein